MINLFSFSRFTLLVALMISVIAAYYSIVGLTAIFSGAVIPIIIMGAALEIAKVTSTVWLHKWWHKAGALIKAYLLIAVLVLASLTSMGIFGLLSKAHSDQDGFNRENIAQIKAITDQIDRNNAAIADAENKVKQLKTSGTNSDTAIQAQIDREQQRIDTAYSRIQPSIDEQNSIIRTQTEQYTKQVAAIDNQLQTLQQYIDSGQIEKAQTLIGTRADGKWGTNTARTSETWKSRKNSERQQLISLAEQANNSATVLSARAEIARLRKSVEDQNAESLKLINRLRTGIGNTSNSESIDSSIAEQNERIKQASTENSELIKQRLGFESNVRKFEAEVGPLKYIAALIYGENPDITLIEQAVRWVIIMIVVVFDPLAIVLILAAISSIKWEKQANTQPSIIDSDKNQKMEPTFDSTDLYTDLPEQDLHTDITQEQNTGTVPSTVGKHQPEFFDTTGNLSEELLELAEHNAIARENSQYDLSKHPYLFVIPKHRHPPGVTPVGPVVYTGHIEQTDESVQSLEIAPVADEGPVENLHAVTEPELISPDTVDTSKDNSDTIITDGITHQAEVFFHNNGYILYNGKNVSVPAFKEIKPLAIIKNANDNDDNDVLFGNQFPKFARTGDIYIRTDIIPHTVFKYNGVKWINVDKNQNSSYLQNINYLQHLISKLNTGEYDPEFLTTYEQEEISTYLKNT